MTNCGSQRMPACVFVFRNRTPIFVGAGEGLYKMRVIFGTWGLIEVYGIAV